jgi:ubiquinone/menaquinone biosynthesis C-methylase UbiE
MVAPHIPENSDILDIGGYDGSFLTHVRDKIKRGICLDPFIEERKDDKIEFVRYRFSDKLPFSDASFDAVTLIAVYEHLRGVREQIAAEVFRVLRNQGYALLTVPDTAVDHILKLLLAMRLIDGMSTFEEHAHFDSKDTVKIFDECGFRLVRWKKFQFGLNNLFIFQKGNRE